MKSVDVGDLPPCAYGPQCLRLLDELDLPAACPSGCLTSIENLQERRQLRQLRAHLTTCSICSALLADARRARAQQRLLLYHVLKANEQQVPSTAHLIIEAMRQTRAPRTASASQEVHVHAQSLSLLARPIERESATPQARGIGHSFQRRGLFHSVLTLATVAVVILAAAGLLNHFSDQTASAPAGGNSSPFEHRQPGGDGWDTVLIGLTMLSASGMVKSFALYRYDTPTDRLERIISSARTFAHVTMEGISHDGQSLLYDLTSADQRTYTVYSPAAGAHTVYQLPAGAGGNAIWVDSSHILVQKRAGLVVELDTRQGTVGRTWPIKAERLVCYHQPFLYFIAGGQGSASALYRANLAVAGAAVHYVADAQSDTRFWLSGDGTTVFYATRGAAGRPGIYAVRADGSDVQLLRAGLGLPIGYTDDNALLLLQQVGGRLEVIRLGRTPAQTERVLLANAAPGATSLCDTAGLVAVIKICAGNVALEPYGHGLLLHAYYANGSHGLVYDNLQTGASQTILTLPARATVQLPGWSKMLAAPAAASQQACLCA